MLEIPAHFRPQLAAASAVATILGFAVRNRGAGTVALALLVANAAPLLPYLRMDAAATAAAPTDLRVLTLNLRSWGTKAGAFHALLADEQPDIVLLTELPWAPGRLLGGLDGYPYRLIDQRTSGHDVLVLSRWRPRAWKVDRSAAPDLPVVSAELCASEAEAAPCVRLIGLHATRPFGKERRRRDAVYAVAARLAREGRPLPTVLMGDLNVTPWAPAFGRLLADARLQDESGKLRLAATWVSRNPLLGLPIDHILTGSGIAVRESRVFPGVGSDHFPVGARLSITPAAAR